VTVTGPASPRMPFSLSKNPVLRRLRLPPSQRIPAPFWSGTFESRNSTLMMVVVDVLGFEITQVPLPCACWPSANRRARPPSPQIVRLLAFQVATSPR
jgi:hypothetical protein